MKIIKKIVSICLLAAVSLFTVPVYASDSNNNLANGTHFTQNEYAELLNEYSSLANSQSENISTHSKLSSLKELIDKYPGYIYSLQKYSEDELKNLNYTDSQIYAIQNYDGSEKMTLAAAATVTGSVTLSSRSYNASTNKTTATVTATVRWNGIPFVRGSDT